MTTPENAAGTGHVHALVGQREQLRAWIAKLDEVQTGATSRVAERVRADYHDRLRRVTEELSTHGEEIQRNLQAVREQLAAAEDRRTQAADALEETRLRHLIGELDDAAWQTASAPLQQEVDAAEQALEHTRAEVEHLSTLAGEIAGFADEGGAVEEEQSADEGAVATADDDAGDELPFLSGDEDSAPALADAGDDAGWEPDVQTVDDGESAEDAGVEEEDAAAAAPAGVSGEELAAWISEVEAEAGGPEAGAEAPAEAPPAEDGRPLAGADADSWDPFANEFGGAPASPATQPGDAAQDLPWLDSLQGGAAGKWAEPAAAEGDDLAFLDNLDAAPPAAGAAPAADLAADDLAFLEELDRAISGGAQRAPQGAASEDAGLGGNFQGGSGGGFAASGGDVTSEQPRKRGEALLCKECGAINEPQAWYCEICGSEL